MYVSSFYSQYQGQSLGRVLHFLYHYVNSNVAEHATIGQGTVTYCGEQIATFKWIGNTPVFEFASKYSWAQENQETKRKYLEQTREQLEYLETTYNEFMSLIQELKPDFNNPAYGHDSILRYWADVVANLPKRELETLKHTVKYWKSCEKYNNDHRNDGDVD